MVKYTRGEKIGTYASRNLSNWECTTLHRKHPEHTSVDAEGVERGILCPTCGVPIPCSTRILITHLEAALERLRDNLPRCGNSAGQHDECEAVGVWEWYDPDGQEWKCDEHQENHFYTNGPRLDEARVAARSVLDE